MLLFVPANFVLHGHLVNHVMSHKYNTLPKAVIKQNIVAFLSALPLFISLSVRLLLSSFHHCAEEKPHDRLQIALFVGLLSSL